MSHFQRTHSFGRHPSARLIAPERTIVSAQKIHEQYWIKDLADLPPENILAQPSNRGTAAGIVLATMHTLRRDPDAIMCFFPADHFYDDELRFQATVESMYDAAVNNPESPILLGATPYYPETEYGWFRVEESGRVAEFHEKPSEEYARTLMQEGHLWNTFVMAGRASTFLELIERSAPQLPAAFRSIFSYGLQTRRARRLYDVLDPVDFSRDVLATSTDRLKALALENVRWSDLGKPERVLATLEEAGIKPHWAAQLQKAMA